MIHLSAAAVQEVRRLQAASHRTQSYLKLSIASGGCKDWVYIMELIDEQPTRDRLHPTNQDLMVAIAPDALPHVQNLTLDYAEDLMGGSFRFENPKITQTCSCGHSFTLPK